MITTFATSYALPLLSAVVAALIFAPKVWELRRYLPALPAPSVTLPSVTVYPTHDLRDGAWQGLKGVTALAAALADETSREQVMDLCQKIMPHLLGEIKT